MSNTLSKTSYNKLVANMKGSMSNNANDMARLIEEQKKNLIRAQKKSIVSDIRFARLMFVMGAINYSGGIMACNSDAVTSVASPITSMVFGVGISLFSYYVHKTSKQRMRELFIDAL